MKDWAYVINLGEYDDIWTHRIHCYIKDDCNIFQTRLKNSLGIKTLQI